MNHVYVKPSRLTMIDHHLVATCKIQTLTTIQKGTIQTRKHVKTLLKDGSDG